jgi:hypothetical protein
MGAVATSTLGLSSRKLFGSLLPKPPSMRTLLGLIASLVLALPSIALCEDALDLAGNWKIHTASHRGYETWETKILMHEGKYEVITIHPYLGRSECVLTLNGNSLKMVFPFTYGAPGTDTARTTFIFTGTIEGDTMRGAKTTRGANTHGDDKPVSWVALKIHKTY